MKSIFYIDPQSGDNLAMYDYELLSRIEGYNLFYVCSKTYNYKTFSKLTILPIFNYTKKRNTITKGISYTLSLISLIKQIKIHKPDIIHIQWFRLPLIDYYFYLFIKRKYKLKIVHTVHNSLPHVKKNNDFINYSRLYSLCDHLIAHTHTSASNLSTNFTINKNKICVAPHGPLKYNFTNKAIASEINNIRNKYKINSKYIVSCLGYQSYYKGTDLAIEAWKSSKILSGNKEICLIVAGQNKDYRTEYSPNSNLIIINQKLSDLEFATLVKMSSLMILPYRKIDQSGVLLTIIEEGIPYCATSVGELCKPFDVGDIGWKFKSASVEDIRNQLEHIFLNPEQIEAKRNKKEVWEKIRALYSWDQASEITAKLYSHI